MVVRGVLRHVAGQLRNFDLVLKLNRACRQTFKQGENNFSLARLQSIKNAWDGPQVVGNREVNQLFVNKVYEAQTLFAVVHYDFWVVGCQPLLALVRLRLRKGQQNSSFFGGCICVIKLNYIFLYVFEVLFCFRSRACAETFIVLDVVACAARLLPGLVVSYRKKLLDLLAFSSLDDWRHKLTQKVLL